MNKDKLLGVRHLSDAMGTWLDPAMKAMQDKVDHMLPNTVNLLTAQAAGIAVGAGDAYADIWPKRTMLYNRETGKLTMVGAAIRPSSQPDGAQADGALQGARRPEIPAWLTCRRAAARTCRWWCWCTAAPVCAATSGAGTRGAVPRLARLRRAAAGIPRQHRLRLAALPAGWKQWGLKMQDDMADGARWAIAQGTPIPSASASPAPATAAMPR
jgi:hypothetical protein